MKSKKRVILTTVILIAIVAILASVYFVFSEKPNEEQKDIVIKVVYLDGHTDQYNVQTNAEYLKGAIDDTEGLTVDGTTGMYGLYVDTVNGVYAEYTKTGTYWGFYVNDNLCNYGVDSQPVEDGDIFKIVEEVS
jgi:hypothetical protein